MAVPLCKYTFLRSFCRTSLGLSEPRGKNARSTGSISSPSTPGPEGSKAPQAPAEATSLASDASAAALPAVEAAAAPVQVQRPLHSASDTGALSGGRRHSGAGAAEQAAASPLDAKRRTGSIAGAGAPGKDAKASEALRVCVGAPPGEYATSPAAYFIRQPGPASDGALSADQLESAVTVGLLPDGPSLLGLQKVTAPRATPHTPPGLAYSPALSRGPCAGRKPYLILHGRFGVDALWLWGLCRFRYLGFMDPWICNNSDPKP